MTIGTTIMTINTQIPIPMMIRIRISFHHICLRTRLAPRRKPWAETASVSVLISQCFHQVQGARMSGSAHTTWRLGFVIWCLQERRTGLVLQCVQAFTALRHLVAAISVQTLTVEYKARASSHVFVHDADSVVDLRLDLLDLPPQHCLCKNPVATYLSIALTLTLAGSGLGAGGDVRVIRLAGPVSSVSMSATAICFRSALSSPRLAVTVQYRLGLM